MDRKIQRRYVHVLAFCRMRSHAAHQDLKHQKEYLELEDRLTRLGLSEEWITRIRLEDGSVEIHCSEKGIEEVRMFATKHAQEIGFGLPVKVVLNEFHKR